MYAPTEAGNLEFTPLPEFADADVADVLQVIEVHISGPFSIFVVGAVRICVSQLRRHTNRREGCPVDAAWRAGAANSPLGAGVGE